jgi:hypothetical protein
MHFTCRRLERPAATVQYVVVCTRTRSVRDRANGLADIWQEAHLAPPTPRHSLSFHSPVMTGTAIKVITVPISCPPSLSVSIPTYLSVCVSVCFSVYLSLSFCLSTYFCIYLSAYLLICLCVYLFCCLYLSVYLSVCHFT